jgi:hypothetical protein
MTNDETVPLFATRFLDGFDPTELPQCRVTRFFRFHPGADVLLRLHLNMCAHFLLHPRIELAFLKKCPKPLLYFL